MPEIEVIIVCEGQTEREFCRSVIKPYLARLGINLSGTLPGNPNKKVGGIRPWEIYRSELIRLARQRSTRHVGFLVDYYRMPAKSWPGREKAESQSIDGRGVFVEDATKADLSELGDRFHPCVQLHEFESLLFVAPEITGLSLAIANSSNNHSQIASELAKIKYEFKGHVEHINDRPTHSPSKRVIEIVHGYDKVDHGVSVTKDVTIDALRVGCPWLDRWLKGIESLGISISE